MLILILEHLHIFHCMQRLLLILLFHELQNFCSVLLLVFSSFKSLFVQAFHLATDVNKFKQVTNNMGKLLSSILYGSSSTSSRLSLIDVELKESCAPPLVSDTLNLSFSWHWNFNPAVTGNLIQWFPDLVKFMNARCFMALIEKCMIKVNFVKKINPIKIRHSIEKRWNPVPKRRMGAYHIGIQLISSSCILY